MEAKIVFKTIKDVALLASPTGDEKLVQDHIKHFLSSFTQKAETDDAGNIWICRGNTYLCAHMDKKGEPGQWTEGEKTIQSRLDDSIGIGVALNLLKENGALSALFTVAEEYEKEDSSRGAHRALAKMKKLTPHLIIVIDTSPLCEMNEGPILYTTSGDVKFRKELIHGIIKAAHEADISIQVTEGRRNDSRIFGAAGLPTVALEAHIENYHSQEEISSKADIMNLYKLINIIIRKL